MGNWFKKLFCGSHCHCHGEKGDCCSNTPKVVIPAEEKPVSESSITPEVKI